MKKLVLEVDLLNITEERIQELKTILEVQLEDFMPEEVEDYGFHEIDYDLMEARVSALVNEYFYAYKRDVKKLSHYLFLNFDKSISSSDLIHEIGRAIEYLNLNWVGSR